MSKVRDSIMLGGLFAAGAIGANYIGQESADQITNQRIECRELFEGEDMEQCFEDIQTKDVSLLTFLEIGGVIGTIACGVVAYNEIRDSQTETV